MKISGETFKAILAVVLLSIISISSVYADIQTNAENLGSVHPETALKIPKLKLWTPNNGHLGVQSFSFGSVSGWTLGSQFVKDSYIVTFKEPTEGSSPLIDPPNQEMIEKAKKGEIQIPFGEPSSGQSKQEVAEKIGLNGEVIAIFDTINAILVKMDAQEAYRLSIDERVLRVEQDRITTTAVTPNDPVPLSVTDSNPTFQESILSLPSVDSPERGGEYQNVEFKLTKEGEWQLLDFVITKELQYLDQVEIIKTDSFPIQVFLKVTGHFTTGCQEMGKISYRLLEQKFDIWMYSTQDEKFSTGEFACGAGFSPFTHIIPLPVYGLDKGEYKYSVNGRYTGTFNLAENNKF